MQDSISLNLTQNDVPTTSDDYYTPPWVFESLGLTFDTDPASPVGGIPWIPVRRYYTLIDDGLSQEWLGRVWLNPPFSKPTPWVNRFLDHQNGVILVPLAKSKWLNDLFDKADCMALLPANMKFTTKRDSPGSIFLGCALFAIGAENKEALQNGNFGRVR